MFTFGIREIGELLNPDRSFELSQSQIADINPNTRTAPVFRSRFDAALTSRIYSRVPILIAEHGSGNENRWHASFLTMFHMSGDSSLFLTAPELQEMGCVKEDRTWAQVDAPIIQNVGESKRPTNVLQGRDRYVPLYEAKMIHHFDHRWATFEGDEPRDVNLSEKTDPNFDPTPRYWVLEELVNDRLNENERRRGWLFGWRDVVNPNVLRTMISAIFPATGVGHKLPLLMSDQDSSRLCGLVANTASIVFDYVVRQKVGGSSLTYFYVKQLPVLPPCFYMPPELDFIIPRVLELTYTSRSMAPFARDLGYDGAPFAWDEDRRALLRAELDAWYARAYGLTRDELRYILDPSSIMGPDYPSETFRVLKEKELKLYKEYRTQRLVLDAWDRMERGELHKPEPYQRSAILLTPPPTEQPAQPMS